MPGCSRIVRPAGSIATPSGNLLLAEIPADFLALKAADFELAQDWRVFTRAAFETSFEAGYLVTDFVFENGHSYYVLTYGQATL